MSPSTAAVTSADGTAIAYRRTGSGPALLVVPGNNRRAHNYDALAAALADAFTVCVIERRGRGESGPQGAEYSLAREVQDLQAVAGAEGAARVFGHSYGGLVTLAAAAADPGLGRCAVFEPAVSIGGSFDLSFRGEFMRLLGEGKHVRAMALFLHRTGVLPFRNPPYPVCWALAALMVGRPGEMRELMATTPAELEVVARADGDGAAYGAIAADILLLSGTKTSPALTGVLDPLARIIPRATHRVLAGADHNAPDESDPTRIAEELRGFFAAPA